MSHLELQAGRTVHELVAAVIQLGDDVLVVVHVEAQSEIPVAGVDHVELEFDIHTAVAHRAHVAPAAGEAGDVGIRNVHKHVLRILVVELDIEGQAVEQAAVDAGVERLEGLPGQVRVAQRGNVPGGLPVIEPARGGQAIGQVIADARVAHRTVGCLELEIVDPVNILQEAFLADVPHRTDRPEAGVAAVGAEERGAVDTVGQVEEILVVIVVRETGEERVVGHFREGIGGKVGLRAVVDVGQALVGLSVRPGGEILVVRIDGLMTGQQHEMVVAGDRELVFGRIGRSQAVEALEGFLRDSGQVDMVGKDLAGIAVIRALDGLDCAQGQALERGDLLIEIAVQAGGGTPCRLGLHPTEVVPHAQVGDIVRFFAVTHEITGSIRDDFIRGGIRKAPGHDVHRVVIARARGRIARRVVRLPGQVQVDADLEPVGDLAVDVRADRVALHIGIRLDALAVKGAQRNIVVAALAAARDAQVGLPGRGVLVEDPFAPVGLDVVLQTEILQFLELGVFLQARVGQFAEGEPFLSVHQLHRELGQIRDTIGTADRDGRLLAGAFLGRDVNHAVGGTRTVDGGRRSVLHHRHILDIVRVEGREDSHVHRRTVEDEQRGVGGIDRVDAAQTHRYRGARLTGTGIDLEAGHLALKGVTGTGGRDLGEGIGFDQRRGTDHGADLLGGTITHHDGLLQEFGVVAHDDVDHAPPGDFHSLGRHSDIGEREFVVGTRGNRVAAVRVRRRVLSRYIVVHRHPDQGFIPGVRDRTGNRVPEVLSSRNGKRLPGCEEHRQQQQDLGKKRFFHRHLILVVVTPSARGRLPAPFPDRPAHVAGLLP